MALSRPDALTSTLLSCVQTSLRLLARRATPANTALAGRYRAVQRSLEGDQALTPSELRLLQRSVVSTGALTEMGGLIEGSPASVTPGALAHAGLALHARLHGAPHGRLVA